MWAAALKTSRLRLVRASETRISGGSSEMEVKELTVTPAGCPVASTVVTTAIPVGNNPNASRNSREVKLMLSGKTEAHARPRL